MSITYFQGFHYTPSRPSQPTSNKFPICPTKYINSAVCCPFFPQFSFTGKNQNEFIGVAVGNELLTNPWATISGKQENRIYTCLHLSSLLRVNPFDVELRKQDYVPM